MRFFHRMANAHGRRNQMAKVKIDGVWVTEDRDLRVAVSRAFQRLLSNNDDWRPSISELSFEGWKTEVYRAGKAFYRGGGV